jgi:hypothetical protein
MRITPKPAKRSATARATADDPDVVIDTTGLLTAWMKRFRTRVLVVRPDRFVAATDATGLDVPGPRGNLDRTSSASSHARGAATTPVPTTRRA